MLSDHDVSTHCSQAPSGLPRPQKEASTSSARSWAAAKSYPANVLLCFWSTKGEVLTSLLAFPTLQLVGGLGDLLPGSEQRTNTAGRTMKCGGVYAASSARGDASNAQAVGVSA